MKLSNWTPNKYDGEFAGICSDRLKEAAERIAEKARSKCPVGTKSRPIYKTGKYAGVDWTARDAGALKRSIRVTEKYKDGTLVWDNVNIRVYAGNYFAYYASIVEYSVKKFMRPAVNTAEIRRILGAK